jgi:hypothetical protein
VLVILKVDGRMVVSPLPNQHIDRICLGSKCQMSSEWHVFFCVTNGAGYWLLMRLLTQMFVVPAMITMTVAATRMYRSLTNFGLPSNMYEIFFHSVCLQVHCRLCHRSALDPENTQRRNCLGSNSKHSSLVPKLSESKQMEVTVHTAYEEHPMSHETHCDAYPSSDGRLSDKPGKLGVDGKVESREVKTHWAINDADPVNV